MRKSFLKETDFSVDQAQEVFELAMRYKKSRSACPLDLLRGQSWAMMFFKKSTRTRLSFQVGLYELGANAMLLDTNELQLSRGESVEDTAKIMNRYLSGLVIRAYEHSLVEDFAKYSDLPVVNALTDFLHPCQSYTDTFTMLERFSNGDMSLESLKGKKFTFFGDTACNMANSLALAGSMFGFEVVLCGPEGFEPSSEVDKLYTDAGIEKTWSFDSDPKRAAKNADVLYTDVWVSMGMEDEMEKRLKLFSPYQVNSELMGLAKDNALFMHCLPAHAGQEVSEEVLNSKASIVFDEAENRLHVQKAIMSKLVK
ncbi:MAG: ornithine carbamoyltransferase [Opitutales bacterium]